MLKITETHCITVLETSPNQGVSRCVSLWILRGRTLPSLLLAFGGATDPSSSLAYHWTPISISQGSLLLSSHLFLLHMPVSPHRTPVILHSGSPWCFHCNLVISVSTLFPNKATVWGTGRLGHQHTCFSRRDIIQFIIHNMNIQFIIIQFIILLGKLGCLTYSTLQRDDLWTPGISLNALGYQYVLNEYTPA